MIILTVLCYFFSHFYSFPKIAVTDCIIYFSVQPMYYDSPKLHILAEVGSAIFLGGALSLECYLFLYVR